MPSTLCIQAGARALAILRDGGLKPETIKVVAGAAGGPKWLILSHIDRFLFGSWITGRRSPLYLVGSSSGAWCFAAAAQADPLAAIDRLERAYIGQAYDHHPSPAAVSREARRILMSYLTPQTAAEILGHPCLRLNFLAVRSRGSRRRRLPAGMWLRMAAATALNAVKRRWLGLLFERVLFHDPRALPPFYPMTGFPLRTVALARGNLVPALLASGAIPLVMAGVDAIPGAPPGRYWDGGVIDYHLDLPYDRRRDGLVLYPHYTDRLVPGWLDKRLARRRPAAAHTRNVLLVSPSAAFLNRLPLGKIPDRTDFVRFRGRDAARIAYWRQAVDAGAALADDLADLLAGGKLQSTATPLPV
ncbi:MAG: patatin-like phospholipase family protein [Desulfobacterales bacterium]